MADYYYGVPECKRAIADHIKALRELLTWLEQCLASNNTRVSVPIGLNDLVVQSQNIIHWATLARGMEMERNLKKVKHTTRTPRPKAPKGLKPRKGRTPKEKIPNTWSIDNNTTTG